MPVVGEIAASCVTIFHNRGHVVEASIGSLLAQTLPDIEIIVVDDGSTDDTPRRIEGLSDDRLRPVFQSNAGFTVSMNRAIATSRGRYVAVHGAGDISLPERIARQVAYLDANPDVGAVGCTREAEGFVIGPRGGVKRGPMLEAMLKRNPFSHGEVMFRRELFDRVGGYREVFRFAQDRDLWLRMGPYCDYAVLPELLYRRDYFPGGVTRTPRNLYLQTKLSQFAVQCAEERRDKGVDPLDALGPAAFFLTRPTRELANKYALWGLRALRDGDEAAADIFLPAAWREHRNLRTTIAWLAERGRRFKIIKPLLVAVLKLIQRKPSAKASDDYPVTPEKAASLPIRL